MRIYISSTGHDLYGHRAAVIAAIRRAGDRYTVACMEDYAAQDELPLDSCLADVARSDVYVGMFAWRYGYVPPGRERSITEMEYREANGNNIPRLIFLADEAQPWPEEHRDQGEAMERMGALRSSLEQLHMVDYFGEPADLATRVLAALIRHEGKVHYQQLGVASTEAQRDAVQRELALYQESQRQASKASRARSHDPIPLVLPRLRGTFVDREVERGLLKRWLVEDARKQVVIVAPAGHGKTELVTRVLKDMASGSSLSTDEVQGILYLKCQRGELSLGQVFEYAGRMVGRRQELTETYARRDLSLERKVELLLGELSRMGKVWLVLDNAEDLLGANDEVTDPELRALLEAAAEVEHTVYIIITSRAVPRYEGSRQAKQMDLDTGLPEEAAVEYLQAEGESLGLADADEALLRKFARRVHGIPKALESVLGYLDAHHPEITLADLMDDPELLADFDRHDNEQGLRRLVTQQINRLSGPTRLLLSALSIFSGPAPRAALQYLLPGLVSTELAELLSRLKRNRLASYQDEGWDLHPLVRELAYNALPEEDGDGALSKNSLHNRAATFWKELRKPKDQWKTIEDLEPHLREIHHRMQAGQYEDAARILTIIDFDYLQLWGHAQVVVELREALRGKLDDADQAITNAGILGLAYQFTDRAKESILCHEEALALSRKENHKQAEGVSLGNLGISWANQGDPNQAVEFFEQALIIAQEVGNRTGEASQLCNLGTAWRALGEPRRALDYCKQALSISRDAGNRRSEAIDLGSLGEAWRDLGYLQRAIEMFEQALVIAREIASPHLIAWNLTELALCHNQVGQEKLALAMYTQAMNISEQDRNGRAAVLCGILHLELGRATEAQACLNQGTRHAQETLNRCRDLYEARYMLALGLLALGQTEKALTQYIKAINNCDAKGIIGEALMYLDLLKRAAPNTPGLTEVKTLLEETIEEDGETPA